MEPVKKRRNSILKKKPFDEDTTTEIKARRISFSGKKSIKEFIAGEEAATIWGTSYEESADDLKVSSCESGLVNLNVKRIQLRNRRVTCEPQQEQPQKRRTSKKKAQVQIAANDKENVYVAPANPSPTQSPVEMVPAPPAAAAAVEVVEKLESSKSQTQSELALIKNQEKVSKLKGTMPQSSLSSKKLSIGDFPNIFSSTFDFINFSGHINKSISIEQSVDVSLNESELQMFKFRVPVTTTGISPNTSNILCRSIMMTDEDVNALKLARKEKVLMTCLKEQTILDEELRVIDAKKRESDGSEGNVSKVEVIDGNDREGEEMKDVGSNSMEITQINDVKAYKRKSERTPISIFMDTTSNEMNSPLRKKPMHTLHCTSMDVTDNALMKSTQMETTGRSIVQDSFVVDKTITNHNSIDQGRQTIHFVSVQIDETTIGGMNYTSSQTIYDSKTINESSSFPNTTASCLAMGHQTTDISMELSIFGGETAKPVENNCRTINLPNQGQMEFTLGPGAGPIDNPESDNMNASRKRESIYSPADMIEESPPKPPPQTTTLNKQKGLKLRQTILSTEKIIEDKPNEIVKQKAVLQKTITTPINIFEDSIQVETANKARQTIHQPIDIPGDDIPVQMEAISTTKSSRGSIYTPSDMIEDSPKSSDIKKTSKVTVKVQRRTIVHAEDIAVDPQMSHKLVRTQKQNKSTMDSEERDISDETEAPPTSTKCLKSRQTICSPEDIMDETTNAVYRTENLQKSFKTPIEIFEDSISNSRKPIAALSRENKSRESIYTPSDMDEDSPQPHKTLPVNLKPSKSRQTILAPENIIDDAVFPNQGQEIKSNQNRQTICNTIDIEEATESAPGKSNRLRQSVYTPVEMLQESMVVPEASPKKKDLSTIMQKTMKTPIDIYEVSVHCMDSTAVPQSQNCKSGGAPQSTGTVSKGNKSRESIYTPTDMIEDSPKQSKKMKPSNVKVSLNRQPIVTLEMKSDEKRKTICNAVEIEEATESLQSTLASAKNNAVRQSVYEPVDMLQESPKGQSIVIPEAKKPMPTKKQPKTNRHTIYDVADIEEDTTKSTTKPKNEEATKPTNAVKANSKRQTTYDVDITMEPVPLCVETTEKELPKTSKQRPQSKIQVFRRQLSSTDLTTKSALQKNNQKSKSADNLQQENQCPSKIPGFQNNLKRRQSIRTPVDMDEDLPDTTDKKHHQTIKTEEAMQTNSSSAPSDKNENRQTVHTPIDMLETSLQPTKPTEIKPTNDLPYRKPTKLIVEPTTKPSTNPYSSPGSLMHKVMEDMGYSMNFQLDFPSQLAPAKSAKSQHMYSLKDLEPSMNLFSVTQDRQVDKSTRAMDVSMMGDDGKVAIKNQQTVFLSEGIALENDSCAADRTSQLCKTSFNQSLMEMSGMAKSLHPTEQQMPLKRQTMHCNQDVDVEDVDEKQETPSSQTMICDEDLETDDLAPQSSKIQPQKEHKPIVDTTSTRPGRKTMHLNEDLELEVNPNRATAPAKGPLQSSKHNKRQTLHLNEKIDEIQNHPKTVSAPNKSERRQTILMNQDLDMSVTNDTEGGGEKVAPNHQSINLYEDDAPRTIQQSIKRKTMHLNEDLEEEKLADEKPADEKVAVKKLPNKRQTILVQQDLDMTVAQKKKLQQTAFIHQKLEMEDQNITMEQSFAQKQPSLGPTTRKVKLDKENTAPKRKTMHLNEDLELENLTEYRQKSPLKSTDTNKRQTMHFHENIDEQTKETNYRRRQTILMNQDLDLSTQVDIQMVSPQAPERMTSENRIEDIASQRRLMRQTKHFNEEFEIEQSTAVAGGGDSKRKTILASQDLDLTVPQNMTQSVEQPSLRENRRLQSTLLPHELEKSTNQSNFSYETRKNTEMNAYQLYRMETVKPEGTQNRKTIHFNNDEDNKMDESCIVKTSGADKDTQKIASVHTEEPTRNLSRRVTIVRQEPINLDESLLQKSSAICSKREEVSPAKIQNRPRRVTICEDQPPMELDDSLLLAPKSTARKSSFSRTLNFDEMPTSSTSSDASNAKNSSSLSRSKVTWQSGIPTSKDDISPIYNPKLKPKVPMTPEVDRSLAEYLKVEAAIEEQEEEDIFYDAEDGTEKPNRNKPTDSRKTCHIPVSILEESGMQPLSSQTLSQSQSIKRQTTFSPRNMTLHHEQSHLGEINNSMEMTLTSKKVDASSTSFAKVHRNRPTLHFNESINVADVSIPNPPRSAAVQSVKELLAENARLFTQSHLMQENDGAEKKRTTMFFAIEDDSMDVSCIDNKSPPEIVECCTPTKNKSSRIPQLIGSAKKLESLKKSMEFIQQELPNIGSHLRKSESMMAEQEDTPRRFSTSMPKKLQEMAEESFDGEKPENPPLMNETFETIDIPRKVISSVRKTIDLSREQESLRPPPVEPAAACLQESFDTVEIPRRATISQRNETLYLVPNEMETTRKSFFQFEDGPITISDVSTFFSKKKIEPNPTTTTISSPCPTDEPITISDVSTYFTQKLNLNPPNSPPKAMSHPIEPDYQGLSRSPDSANTTHNLAAFKKRYVDLSDLGSAIEKTHLSLVNTLDDESEMVDCPSEMHTSAGKILSPEVLAVAPVASAATVEKEVSVRQKPNSSVCKKCKCRRLSTTQNETTIGSFMLEALPVYEIDLSELEQLKKKPNICNVGKIWRQKIRESDSFNVSDGSRSMAIDDENAEEIQLFLKELAEERLVNEKLREQTRKEVKIEDSFVCKVRRKIQSEPNWLVNELLLLQNTIVLTHKHLRTFAIIINFTPKDPRGVEVNFNEIKFKRNKCHTRQWKPFEYTQHYQLLVELPFDLKTICPTSENFFELLEHVDKVTQDVLRTVKEMQSLILPSPASLIREPSGRIYIRKYTRTKSPQNDVKHTEFHIEVRNIKKLSFESITMPPLYEFDENIQLLPVGNDFLRIFLNDPMKFMKA